MAFVKDPSPFKTAVCSRRAGKTTACAFDLFDTASRNDSVVCLYITLSRANAKKLIWRELLKVNQENGNRCSINSGELSLSFPNGSVIYISGAKDRSEIEKFRGLPLKKVYIDECQAFRSYLKELIDDVISPALMDHAGELSLIGTPGPIPSGLFYDSSLSGEWSHHAWTFFDNPHIKRKSRKSHQELLDRELKRRGVIASDPSIQREFFGRWVLDSNSLLIHYNPETNHFVELPQEQYTYIMGVDFGIDDADAIAVLGYHEKSPNIFLVEECVVRGQDITSLMGQIEQLRKKYNISKIIADTGGLGKKIAEELIRRHQLPIVAADKVRKMENVKLLNDYLRTGRFKANKGSRFAQDSFLVEIDRDKTTPDRIVVSSSYHSDIIDSVLYAFKECYAYTWTPEKPKPKYGSREWAKEEADAMEEQAFEHFKDLEDKAKAKQWWED